MWVAPRVNLRELALLRFIEGKTERKLALHFNRSKTAIHELLTRMNKNDLNMLISQKMRRTKSNGKINLNFCDSGDFNSFNGKLVRVKKSSFTLDLKVPKNFIENIKNFLTL